MMVAGLGECSDLVAFDHPGRVLAAEPS
jgi:hypothetical protein